MAGPPLVPNHRRRLPVPPPPRVGDPGQSGTMPRPQVPHVPELDDPTPKASNPTLLSYQALCAVFDEASPAVRLELVELDRIAVGLTPADRRLLLELASRLEQR